MTDLQCPARVLLAGRGDPAEGALAEGDPPWADVLIRVCAAERVAQVYAAADQASGALAAVVAERLGVGMAADPVDVTSASGLPDLADLHRGEALLVVLPERLVEAALRAVGVRAACARPVGDLTSAGQPGAAADPFVRLQGDSSGWVLVAP